MSEQNDMLRMLYDNERRLAQTEVKEVPGNIPGFTSFYATGTFVPVLKGNVTPGTFTFSTQAGFYTRIGNRCFYNLSVAATAVPVAPTGAAIIDGLPFTSISTANSHSPVALDTLAALTLTGTIMMLTARIPPGTTFIELIEVLGTAPTGVGGLAAAGLGAGVFIRASGHYMV